MKQFIRILIALIFIFETIGASGQKTLVAADKKALNIVGFNFLGDISFISLNYERLFAVDPKLVLSAKLGIGYNFSFSYFGSQNNVATVPLHLTANYGNKKHFLELGMGATYIAITTPSNLIYPLLGYRLMPLKSGKFNFRVYVYVPTNVAEQEGLFFVPIGFNFGVSF